MKIINDFIRPLITDTETIALKKECIREILESNYLGGDENFKLFFNTTKQVLLKTTFKSLVRDFSYLELKKERIKNYMLYLESEAFNLSENEKNKLRLKWIACKRWLATIEKTEKYDIQPPIELLRD